MYKKINFPVFAVILFCLFITINLDAQKNKIEEVWTDMRPLFKMERLSDGTIRMAFPMGTGIDFKPQANGPAQLDAFPQAQDIDIKPIQGGRLRYAFPNGNDIDFRPLPSGAVQVANKTGAFFEIIPLKDGTIRMAFPDTTNIDIRPQANGPAQLNAFPDSSDIDFKPIQSGGKQHTGKQWITQLVPTKDGKVQVSLQPRTGSK